MSNKLIINADLGKLTISKHIYGHFAEHLGRCIYEGIWVGEDSPIPNTRGMRNDVIAALKKLQMPNLRWPGGCFADTYHWKDGIGPRADRPSIVNIHWGGVTENNHFGTHEFLDFCDLIATEPYICGNVGSGTVQEMTEWLEYLTMPGESPMAKLRRKNGRQDPWKIKYWAVGNENWGCGGRMRPEYYADLYRQYSTYTRNYAGEPLYKIACGLDDHWNEIIMKQCHSFMEGLSVHYYTRGKDSWEDKGPSTQFGVEDWNFVMKQAHGIDEFIQRTSAIMDRYDPAKKIGIIMDEWGTWWNVEPGTNPGFLYQQNTMRDAVVAGHSLNIFNKHACRVHMANIAQTVNVLQAMILTEGPKMLLTPTYHVFDMYKVHQGAALLPTHMDCDQHAIMKMVPQLSASASQKDGKIHVSLCNLCHERGADLTIETRGASVTHATGQILTSPEMNTMNTFEKPNTLVPVPIDVKVNKSCVSVSLPAKCVVMLELQ